MSLTPKLITQNNFCVAWKDALKYIFDNKGSVYNLVVQITDPIAVTEDIDTKYVKFCIEKNILQPKHVSYTIFPHKIYYKKNSAARLYDFYNRENGFYRRAYKEKLPSTWGTYFRRMTFYEFGDRVINQLDNIITKINERKKLKKHAYTIIIQNPIHDTTRPMGGPCLNYIALQFTNDRGQKTVGLLAVYRNHDFLKKAYGNYWGLNNLIQFIANEVKMLPGPLTCISSHAYFDNQGLAKELLGRLC